MCKLSLYTLEKFEFDLMPLLKFLEGVSHDFRTGLLVSGKFQNYLIMIRAVSK